MFFILSKILYFFIQPLNWVVVLLLCGLFGRNKGRRKWMLTAGALLVFFFTNPLVLNIVTRLWELEPVPIASLEQPYDVGIVLGGFSRVVEEFPDRLHLTEHPNRLTQAIELYKAGKVRKILVTGGSPRVIGERLNDSEIVRRFLLDVGIPEGDLAMESRSRNTHENAVYSLEFIRANMPGARCLIITSAFHMRRGAACFRKAGLEVTPFVTDQQEDAIDHPTPNALIVPNPRGFVRWEMLVKEWVGMTVYWLKGYV